MKNVFLGLSVMAALLASCSKDEVFESNGIDNPAVIGFEASTGKTRAASADLATIQGDAVGFGVYATNSSNASFYIDNKAYVYDGGKWKWKISDIMWPTANADYPMNFYAYYPYDNSGISLTMSSLKHNYNVANSTQLDLLAANKLNVVTRPSSGNTTFNFVHILSKIDFKVITGAAVTVEVQSISVNNVGPNGRFDFGSLSWDSGFPTNNASSYEFVTAAKTPINKFVNATASANVDGTSGSLMLMPQDRSTYAWDGTLANISKQSLIEVVYRVYETTSGKDVVGFSDASKHPNYDQTTMSALAGKPLFVKVGFSLSGDWKMSKNYIYTIYLGDPGYSGGKVINDKHIDDKGKNTTLPVVDPSTGTTITVPGPITDSSKPIGFIVSVDNWGTPVENAIQ